MVSLIFRFKFPSHKQADEPRI